MFESDKTQYSFRYGVFFMLLAGFSFAAMSLFVNLAGDLPAPQKVFVRTIIIFLVAGTLFLRQGNTLEKISVAKKNIPTLILRSLFGTMGMVFHFYAISKLTLAAAGIFNKISPFFAILFAAILLKEHVSKAQVLAILIAFTGVVIMLNPHGEDFSAKRLFPSLIAIAGGISAGAAYTFVRKLGSKGVDSSLIVAFFAGFSALVLLPWVILHGQAISAKQLIYLILVGIFGLGGQYGVTLAYKFAPPNEISIFDYSNIIFATLLGIFFLNEIPGINILLGMVILFSAFLVMYLIQRKKAASR